MTLLLPSPAAASVRARPKLTGQRTPRDHGIGHRLEAGQHGIEILGKGAGAFDKAFLVHQRPADVGVHDQRIGRAIGVLDASHVAALQAVGRAGWRSLLPQVLDLRADPVVDVRAAAYEATADCLDGRTKEVLWPGLADASPLVVETCLRRLGEAADPEIVRRVHHLMTLSLSSSIRCRRRHSINEFVQ